MDILLIGSDDSSRTSYINAIYGAGGTPHYCYAPENPPLLDGLVVCGGTDINPALYSQSNTSSNNIDDKRDKAELAAIDLYFNNNKPIMGICRGHQLLNVYFGGTLCQNINNAEMHRLKGVPYSVHPSKTVNGSFLEKLFDSSFNVNSAHHQGIEKLGNGLFAVQFTDNIIEAFAHTSGRVFGVQWHPERMCGDYRSEEYPDSTPLFRYFLDLAR